MVLVQLLAMCRGELSAVIVWLMYKWMKQVEMVERCEKYILPLPLLSCEWLMFVKENPGRKKKQIVMACEHLIWVGKQIYHRLCDFCRIDLAFIHWDLMLCDYAVYDMNFSITLIDIVELFSIYVIVLFMTWTLVLPCLIYFRVLSQIVEANFQILKWNPYFDSLQRYCYIFCYEFVIV